MLPFATLLLRRYYEAIGWNEDNLYSNITRSSSALIDFPVPDSLILQLANAPTPIFFTSYALDALPQLNGSLSYLTTSEPLSNIGPSASMPFATIVDKFRVPAPPLRPQPKDEIWLAGRQIQGRDYLMYSRLHLPTMHLSGLATTRITPTLAATCAFVHQPATERPVSPSSATAGREAAPVPKNNKQPGNVLLSLQHDTGRYSGEYTYSAADGMFGIRQLYNFGWEEEMMDGGLRGRFSLGGEVYVSVKQRSAGLSTGVRFTTLPGSSSPNTPPSPPTTITVLYNPLIGFLSTAYAAQIAPTVSVATRFGVNVYSYESDFAIGGEWWIGRRRGKRGPEAEVELSDEFKAELAKRRLIGGVLRAADDDDLHDTAKSDATPLASHKAPPLAPGDKDRDGVLKARLSGNWSIAMLYESRIRNCLVSVGLISDILNGNSRKVIRSVGLEVQYYS
ncbi:hypothetical protein VHUM_03063 [Vanrija humicola]|uniref:Mitochondrial distribution and morphology protein 10 n=1 Tax=Vanrija humicola TaxID=5417 RepID=A0A7D8Z1H4_VANHU|nr:hypothetical protein VHUM_03063 [Vanrija humicola]